jgi:hypothetical protein
MTIERSPGPPPEPAPSPGPTGAGGVPAEPTPVQVRLQILSTEHWSLIAARGLAWNEVFSRAGMFLSTLSGSMVALGLIAGVDGFHDAFFVFALVILPVVLFIGLGTWIRMGAANYHDALSVAGMNRIRAGYLEIAPDLRPYFVMGVHDDAQGIGITMAVPPGTRAATHVIAATPFLVTVLNSVISGAIVATALVALVRPTALVVVIAALVTAAVVLYWQQKIAVSRVQQGQVSVRAMFPTPGGPPPVTRIFGADIPDFGKLSAEPERTDRLTSSK